MLTLKALPAYDGDCFIISLGEGNDIKNIIIDGGRKRLVVNKLKKEIQDIKNKGQVIDLMILTHIDNDHIYGLIKLFEENWINKEIIKEVWFNSKEIIGDTYFNENANDDLLQVMNKDDANISFKQGITFSKRLEDLDIKIDKVITAGYSKSLGDAKLKVISPEEENLKKLYSEWDKAFPKEVVNGVNISSNKESDYNCSIDELLIKPYEEDKALVNGSSIAFILEYKDKRVLMLADAHPSIIIKNLREIYGQTVDKIYMDLIKLSHHGSKRNINEEFVNNI
ncbi:MBL fold metallo-hydrolase, partial [Bacillus sp. JJ722]|uniref:MBL fold metallo-hydrolase n=1 Tax=Bacillus sp. JJ722 TaxID=3122973 RepID=UPI002FFE04FC